MSKADLDRFTATLDNLTSENIAGFTLGTRVKTAIAEWLRKNPGTTKLHLGGKIGLGGVRIFKDDATTNLRHLRRAVLLAYRTIGGGNDAGMAAVKTRTQNFDKQKLRAELESCLPPVGAAMPKVVKAEGGFGTFEYAPSFCRANTREHHEGQEAFSKASLLLNKAWSQGLMRMGDPTSVDRFERWFGPYGGSADPSFVKVRDNLQKIHKALCERTVKLYYRGAKAQGGSDLPIAEPWSVDGLIHPGSFFGAAWPVQPAAFDQTKTHMLLGSAFFDTLRHGADSTAGVIIHELSHAICQTKDEIHPGTGQTCYGHVVCQDIAQNHVALAINNADNYEFFCEEFWEGVFRQKPQSATNAIPDDLKRKIQNVL